MPEITITKPVALKLKSKKGKEYTLIKEDGEEQGYFAWDSEIGDKAKQAEENGQSIIIEHDGDLNYPTVSAIKGTATHTNGANPTKTAENPQTQKSIAAAVAIKAAVDAMTHTIPSSATPKEAWEKIGPLYHKFMQELAIAAAPPSTSDEDIPF